MRKSFFLGAITLIAFMFPSCSDNLPVISPTPVPQEKLDDAKESWTVMFYSVGGGDLDTAQVYNIAEAFLSDYRANINMTFEFKFSKAMKNRPWEGVGRFDLNTLRSSIKSITMDNQGVTDFINFVGEKVTIIGNSSTDMSSAATLSDFINWSKIQHPATHYLLVLSDHGSGYDILADNNITPINPAEEPETDNNAGEQARHNAILADDFNHNAQANNAKELSLINTIAGITGAMGTTKLDAIYTDACLMATIENLCGYKSIANYYIGSEELTPGIGGNYTQLLNLIGKNSTSTWTWASAYTDYLVSDNHWGSSVKSCADAGVYDLQSTSFDAAVTQVGLFGQALGQDLAAGGAKADSVNLCVKQAQTARDITNPAHAVYWMDGKYTISEIQNNIQKYWQNYYYKRMTEFGDSIKNSLINAVNLSDYGLTIADFMSKMAFKDSRYKTYYTNYIQSLKQCAHLVITYNGDPYEYTSMSVNVFGMTTEALAPNTSAMWIKVNGNKDVDFINNWSKYGSGSLNAKTATELLTLYRTTAFEQSTKWAENFLTKLKVNPGPFWNPSIEVNK